METTEVHPQKFLNGEVHDWYRSVFGYSDHLVNTLLTEFGVEKGETILDPFCGSGTTLVEAKKMGINSFGLDANPASVFAARVKTNWRLKSETLEDLFEQIEDNYRLNRTSSAYKDDPTYHYLKKTGMIDRGWINTGPLERALQLKKAILELDTNATYRNFLFLLLLSEVVYSISNIKFGPTLYCGTPRARVNVLQSYGEKLASVSEEIPLLKGIAAGIATVNLGDARECSRYLPPDLIGAVSAIITSPPYPTEHDYSRNTRLELAFLEIVSGKESLQRVKKKMLRSNTKGIYISDDDGSHVEANKKIEALVSKIEPEAKKRTHGFARLYTTVLREYFGGMKRHLRSVKPYLKRGGKAAYIVGDQSSYFGIHIPTAKILRGIAEEVGFEYVTTRKWRSRWASSSSKEIDENILIVRKR